MKRVLNISLIALASALLLWACGGGGPSAADVGKQFMDALTGGEEGKALELCYDKTCKEMVKTSMGEFKGKEVSLGEASEYDEGHAADIKYTLGGEEHKLTLKQTDEKKWLVKFRFSSPRAVATAFLRAMEEKNYEKAKAYADKESAASIEMIASMNGDKEGGDPDNIEIGEIKIEGDKATVAYTNAGKPLTLELSKDGKEWKAAWEKGGPNPGGDDDGSGLGEMGDELNEALEDAMNELSAEIEESTNEE